MTGDIISKSSSFVWLEFKSIVKLSMNKAIIHPLSFNIAKNYDDKNLMNHFYILNMERREKVRVWEQE